MNSKRKIIQLKIEAIGFEGISIARSDGFVYFVKGGVPGDTVLAEIIRKKKTYYECRINEILEPSPHRQQAPCIYFGVCGGCSWQNIDFPEQLKWKQRHIEDAFYRIGKIPNIEYKPILSLSEPWHYRNKMEFSFGASRWLTNAELLVDSDIAHKYFALGLHVSGRYDKVLDIEKCLIQPEGNDNILNTIREQALRLDVSAYHEVKHIGFLRHLVIRRARATDDCMVNLITNKPVDDIENDFLKWFYNDFNPEVLGITSMHHAVNSKITPVAIGDIIFSKGQDYITEKILGLNYKISPFSFFQTNSQALDGFIGKILETAKINGSQTVWDLYCGTGSISLPAAVIAGKVIGIELSQSSVNDANNNKNINSISNVDFICSDLHSREMPELLRNLERPDIIILDPPRSGMTNNLIENLMEIAPPKIVYVSCNPVTQARDCALLSEKYDIISAQPVDMFPQTYHLESIALLTRK
ncbi:MAG: SAM-dependent methyltransferase [Ignavibacteria bacterium]|nr:SAM-dependent methyltransferase [Ignavibacteria bacterium]